MHQTVLVRDEKKTVIWFDLGDYKRGCSEAGRGAERVSGGEESKTKGGRNRGVRCDHDENAQIWWDARRRGNLLLGSTQ